MQMAVPNPIQDTGTGEGGLLDRLVHQQGLKRFAFFLLSGEGEQMPDGSEELSGYVVEEGGRVFSFWLSWDAERGGPMLSEWEEETPAAQWLESEEYRRARERVGLSTKTARS